MLLKSGGSHTTEGEKNRVCVDPEHKKHEGERERKHVEVPTQIVVEKYTKCREVKVERYVRVVSLGGTGEGGNGE